MELMRLEFYKLKVPCFELLNNELNALHSTTAPLTAESATHPLHSAQPPQCGHCQRSGNVSEDLLSCMHLDTNQPYYCNPHTETSPGSYPESLQMLKWFVVTIMKRSATICEGQRNSSISNNLHPQTSIHISISCIVRVQKCTRKVTSIFNVHNFAKIVFILTGNTSKRSTVNVIVINCVIRKPFW